MSSIARSMDKKQEERKKWSKAHLPAPVPPAPLGGLFISLTTGFLAESYAMATSDVSFETFGSFLQVHTVTPPSWKKGLLGFLVLAGTITYFLAFISVFTTRSNRTRKIADVAGWVGHIINLWFNITHVVGPEARIAGFLSGKGEMPSAAEQASIRSELIDSYHIAFALAAFMLVQQWVVFASQRPVLMFYEDEKEEEPKPKKKSE